MSRLFGRASECAALDSAVAAARKRSGGSLIITGGPGAGKSGLLDYVTRSVSDAEIIRIEGLESESGIGLAGLHRLLLFHQNGRGVLPPAQRYALDASLGVDESADGSYSIASPFLLGLAVLTLLGDLSRARLLVCLIDDAHWLDAESAQVLAFVARRLQNERIFMLFAAREIEAAGSVFTGIPELPVPPLDLDDAVELLLAAAGDIPLDRRVARQIAARAEGNPLALTEVGRELAARRDPPRVLLDEPLPIGARLRRHYESGIRGVPEDTRQLLLLAAANMRSAPGTLWRAAELAGIKESAADPAEQAGLITREPDLRFRHPLIRSAAYDSASAREKREAHGVLADAARALDDRLAAAWHLAAATDAPDEAVAAELEAAARSAHDRGSALNESAFLTRAAELSPDGKATRRRLRAAEAALFGGAPLRAESLASQLPPDAAPGDRAQAEHLRVQARLAIGQDVAEAPALLLDAALSCLRDAPVLAREILLEAVTAAFSASQLMTTITPAQLGDRILAAIGGDPADTPEDLLLTGLATLLSGDCLTAAPLLREAIAALAAAPGPRECVPVWVMAATFAATAIWEDRFALEWLARCEDLARRTGAMRPLTLCLIGASISNAARGQLALAEQQTAEGRELARGLGWTASQLVSFSAVRVLAFRGDRRGLRRAIATARGIAVARGSGDVIRVAHAAEIILHLGYGEYPEAYEAAVAMRDEDTIGMTAEALPAIVEAGLRSGHVAEAEAALAELERYATASGTGWALGLLARSRALLVPPEEAAPRYEKAIDLLGRTRATADLARAHLLYGEWLRRHQHPADARPHLEKALSLFTAMGATPFASRAQTELQAAGALAEVVPQPRNPALTAREHQIASMAAAGYTNQEIANRLFITANTVEYHLKKVFRKLAIDSRRQLRDTFS